MKIIIAPDSFKGSLTAEEAARAIALGIQDVKLSIETVQLPVADGGEGTMESLVHASNGKFVSAIVKDPLGRAIGAKYGVLGDGKTCVIEMAEASGLLRLTKHERNPLITSTYGTGQLIMHALENGYREFIIGLGGSATNDGGVGMLTALGAKFLNDKGSVIEQGGGHLKQIEKIDLGHFDKRIAESQFIIASDVKNPLVGIEGASRIFGPQKGATPDMVKTLDENLVHYANKVEELTGQSFHHVEGAGAAGGLGAGMLAFLPSKMKQGIHVILDALQFESHIKQADLVITGEGKTDHQTLSGKTPIGIAEIANAFNKETILISGTVDEKCIDELSDYFVEIHTIKNDKITQEQAMSNAFHYLRKTAQKVIQQYIQ